MKAQKKRIFTRYELMQIPVKENEELFVDLRTYAPEIISKYEKFDNLEFIGEAMLVRETVAKMLKEALQKIRNVENYSVSEIDLQVLYGYRHPIIQKKYNDKRVEEFRRKFPDMLECEVLELAHIASADPKVAGHTTGGAVDVTFLRNGRQVDMGSKVADFSNMKLIEPFCTDITKKQYYNRILLREIMTNVGFAPFDGEFWHFSYGDIEWAAWYNQENAIYNQYEINSWPMK